MRIYDNGAYRDATDEEVAFWDRQELPDNNTLSDSERLDALEPAIKEGLKL